MTQEIAEVLEGRRVWVVALGDSRETLRSLPDASLDAAVTDPPYELGFMGKAWDGTGIAYDPAFWREVLRVLKPGGHLLAFGATRTYHRMTVAIEDAGFEIRDSLHWMYGTGFPKSLNVGDGRGTALKPGHEPIVLARKPLVGTVAANVAAHGTGALNIDACRLGSGSPRNPGFVNPKSAGLLADRSENARLVGYTSPSGRWPPNVLLDEGAALELDEATRDTVKPAGAAGYVKPRESYSASGYHITGGSLFRYGDKGGPSRFFYVAKANRKERDFGCDALPERGGGEATDREDGSDGLKSPRAGAGRTGGARNHHPTVKPVDLMRYLCRLVTPPGGVVLDPFTGSGTTGMAALAEGCRFIGCEREAEYLPIANARIGATAATKQEEAAGQLGLFAEAR